MKNERTIEIQKDYAGNRLVIKNSQDVGGILEDNMRDQIDGVKDLSFGRKIASVPVAMLDHWITEGIDYRRIQYDLEHRKKFYAKLREWKKLKTYSGGIGQ
tara:strand:- start:619 stop:921 length:303 start_codon:yes stop_codon:yes gene_type:complete